MISELTNPHVLENSLRYSVASFPFLNFKIEARTGTVSRHTADVRPKVRKSTLSTLITLESTQVHSFVSLNIALYSVRRKIVDR